LLSNLNFTLDTGNMVTVYFVKSNENWISPTVNQQKSRTREVEQSDAKK